MTEGFCVNCERQVEVDQHGRCTKCQGESIMDKEHRPNLSVHEVVDKANQILQRLESTGMTGASPLDEAAMFLIVARLHILRGAQIDLFMENAIFMWRAAMSTIAQTPEDLARAMQDNVKKTKVN